MSGFSAFRRPLTALALFACWRAPHADVRLPAIVGDNMVLQQGVPTQIWGWADPGEKVDIRFGSQWLATVEGKGDDPWRFELPPLAPGIAPQLTISGRNTIAVRNILVGEVWLCSGQSNMEMSVRAVGRADGRDIIDPSQPPPPSNPQIRLFDKRWGRWLPCADDAASSFSAVGYHFGICLQRELNVPVGLIAASWGGTRIEPWTPFDAIRDNPEFAPAFAAFEEYKSSLPELTATYERKLSRWEAAAETSRSLGLQLPRPPRQPHPPYRFEPAGLFREYISPLVPFTIRGVAWYQGESNRDDGYRYAKLLSAMIDGWRKAWNRESLPFLIVQIANYHPREAGYPASPEHLENLASLRAAQAAVAAEKPQAALVVTIDIGDPNDIHPRNKQEVGRRLMLAALKLVYGYEDLVASGPTMDSARRSHHRAIVRFANADGLSHTSQTLSGFEVAGPDNQFFPAQATIQNDEVILVSDRVTRPQFVRYGWGDSPVCTLVNAAQLPAIPFKTQLLE